MTLSTEPGAAMTFGGSGVAALVAARMLSRRSFSASFRALAAESTTTGFLVTGAGGGATTASGGDVVTGVPALATSPPLTGAAPRFESRTTNAAPTSTT